MSHLSQVKVEHQRPTGFLQPLEVAEWKYEHVTMDFMTHFPRTLQGPDAVWVIVDRLTKAAHFLVVWMTLTVRPQKILIFGKMIKWYFRSKFGIFLNLE